VTLICVFLVWVVAPLFLPGSLEAPRSFPAEGETVPPLRVAVDEYRVISWVLRKDGTVQVQRTDSGRVLETRKIIDGATPTAYAFAEGSGRMALGFEDGSVRVGTIGFKTEFFDADEVPAPLANLEQGRVAEWKGGMVQVTPERQLRLQTLHVELGEPRRISPPSPVVRLDLSLKAAGGTVLAAPAVDRTVQVTVTDAAGNPLPTAYLSYRLANGDDVKVEADGSGTLFRATQLTLAPHLHWQLGSVFAHFTDSEVSDGYIVVSTDTADGRFLAYASVVDNHTGDPVFIPAIPITGTRQ